MYYEINETTARRAHDNMSMRDYRAGSATAEYRAAVDRAAAELEEVKQKCKTQDQRERAEYLFDRYARKLAEAINRDNEIGTRCPSVMISGAGNFPVRKKEKQVAAWEANRENFKKADYYLGLMRRAHLQTVQSDDPEAIEYLESKLAGLEAAHQRMKDAKDSQTEDEQHDGYTYREDSEIMRVQFIFDGKPDAETRDMLKANGFRWAPSQGAWQRQLTPAGKAAADRVKALLDNV